MRRAGGRSRGAVAASDAFFPFADGIESAGGRGGHGGHTARRFEARWGRLSRRRTSTVWQWCLQDTDTSYTKLYRVNGNPQREQRKAARLIDLVERNNLLLGAAFFLLVTIGDGLLRCRRSLS